MVPNPDARNNPKAPATIKSPVVIKWGWARQYLEPAIMDFESHLFMEQPLIEQKAMELRQAANGDAEPEYLKLLTPYTDTWARGTMQKWWEMGNFFWAYYARGW